MGATPTMNRSAKGGARSSPHYRGEGVLIPPPHQGVCGRHGTEEQCVTSGGLAASPGGTARQRFFVEEAVHLTTKRQEQFHSLLRRDKRCVRDRVRGTRQEIREANRIAHPR